MKNVFQRLIEVMNTLGDISGVITAYSDCGVNEGWIMCHTEFVVICTILPQVHKHSELFNVTKYKVSGSRVKFFLIPETILI